MAIDVEMAQQNDMLLDVVGKAYGNASHSDFANQQSDQPSQLNRSDASPLGIHDPQETNEAADLSMSVSFKSRLRQKTQEKIEEKQKKKSEKIKERQQQQADASMQDAEPGRTVVPMSPLLFASQHKLKRVFSFKILVCPYRAMAMASRQHRRQLPRTLPPPPVRQPNGSRSFCSTSIRARSVTRQRWRPPLPPAIR